MHDDLLKLVIQFEWDEWNREKNYRKHDVTIQEAEEVFINEDIILAPDTHHSQQEIRHYLYGQTNEQRLLIITFTIRQHKVRVIMARDMSKKERAWYEKEIEKDS